MLTPKKPKKKSIKKIGPNKYAKEQIIDTKNHNAYVATNKGTIHSVKNGQLSSMDTTGYSKNKPFFEVKKGLTTFKVSRKNVPSIINKWKSIEKKEGGPVKTKSLPKAQKGMSVKPTADSTDYYNYKAKVNFQKASDRYSLASPEMRKKASEYSDKAIKAQNDALRQSKKGKPGYDKNGFPIKKTTTKKKG